MEMQEKITPKQIRLRLELTQDEIAKKVGMTREHYQKLESDSSLFRKTKIDVAIKLSELASIPLNDINFFY